MNNRCMKIQTTKKGPFAQKKPARLHWNIPIYKVGDR